MDLDGEGTAGILTDAGGSWIYKPNLSPINLVLQTDGSLAARASFGAAATVAKLPSLSTLGPGGAKLLDLAGDGRLDVVDFDPAAPGFFKRTGDYDWESFQRFWSIPQVDWNGPNLRFIDLTGDGLADVLLTEDGLYTYYGFARLLGTTLAAFQSWYDARISGTFGATAAEQAAQRDAERNLPRGHCHIATTDCLEGSINRHNRLPGRQHQSSQL